KISSWDSIVLTYEPGWGKVASLKQAQEKSLDRVENVGFDIVKYYLFPSFIERHATKGVGLRVADSDSGSQHEDDFTPLETIRRFLGVIGSISLSSSEGRPLIQIGGYAIKPPSRM
nr:hypothetical protein [Tanacetum cinerariifolium]